MEFGKCERCKKKMIMSAASFSEVRRAAFGMDLCICPESNIPSDIRIILSQIDDAKRQRRLAEQEKLTKTIKAGDHVMVFDNLLWEKNGGDSKTDDFMRKATVLTTDHETATVQFHHDGRTSRGHFLTGIKKVQ